LSSGLLQLHAVWHVRLPSAEGSERRCTSGHRSSTSSCDQTCSGVLRTISRLCCISCVGCLSVNESSTRLHAWYASSWLVKHPHTEPTTSNSLWTVIAVSYVQPPPGHAQQLRRSKLQCCRPPRVKQFTAAPATRHELCALQASTENISIRELVNHGAL